MTSSIRIRSFLVILSWLLGPSAVAGRRSYTLEEMMPAKQKAVAQSRRASVPSTYLKFRALTPAAPLAARSAPVSAPVAQAQSLRLPANAVVVPQFKLPEPPINGELARLIVAFNTRVGKPLLPPPDSIIWKGLPEKLSIWFINQLDGILNSLDAQDKAIDRLFEFEKQAKRK